MPRPPTTDPEQVSRRHLPNRCFGTADGRPCVPFPRTGRQTAVKLRDNIDASASLNTLIESGLLEGYERDAVYRLVETDSPFTDEVELAEALHLHIKVDDTHQLPINDFFAAGARLDHQKDGFVKYGFPGAINAIFSHIKVSQEELLETEANRRPRPFLDHIGIDLRDEVAPVRAAFDSLATGFSLLQSGVERSLP